MKFTIKEVKAATAIVEYEDGSWAEVGHLGKTEDEFMALVWDFSPKPVEGEALFALSAGMEGNVEAPVEEEPPVPETAPEKTALELRRDAYGPVDAQIEFITENGLAAWREHVDAIKAMFPLEEAPEAPPEEA